MSEMPTDRTTADWIAEQVEKNPELAEQFESIVKALDDGHLSLAEIGGFAPEEIDAAHACACHHLTLGEPEKALAVASALLLLDQRRAAFHLTAAIAMHHLKRYAEADESYGRADELRPDDPVTLMYRGEARILADQHDAGIPILKRGIELAGDDATLKPYVHRAARILKIAETKKLRESP